MRVFLLALIIIFVLSGCSGFPDEEVKRAKLEIENLYNSGLPKYMPDEWSILKDVWQKLDEAEQDRNKQEALKWFYYTEGKISVLEEMLKKRKKDEELLRKEKRELEKKKVELEKKEAILKNAIKKTVIVKKELTMDDIRGQLEKRYPSFYTVKDGDTLDSIAELPSIYNDISMWPLIYQYNRNQIKDPQKLYPGQILKIPRTMTMEEIYKARENAGVTEPKKLPAKAFTPAKYQETVEELLSEE